MALTPFVRFSFGGTNAGSEQWQCGISVASSVGVTAAQLNTWLGLMVAPHATWWATASGPNAWGATDTICTQFRAAQYEASATTASATAQLVLATPKTGAGISDNPLQCAVVQSLHTGLAGKRANGRFYLPATGYAFNSTNMPSHQLTSAVVTAAALGTANWLTAVGALALGSGSSIVSIAVPGGTPVIPVTQVTVDSIIDTQRRRRNRQVALFTGAHAV